MMTAGYFLVSCALVTFGSTTFVLTLTGVRLPGSSSVCSISAASVFYLTRRPSFDARRAGPFYLWRGLG